MPFLHFFGTVTVPYAFTLMPALFAAESGVQVTFPCAFLTTSLKLCAFQRVRYSVLFKGETAMGFVFLVCCAAAGESPVDICLPGNGGKAAAVPLRYRLIALGFVKKLTPEEVNRKLAEEMAMSEENFYLYKTYLRSESSEKKWEKLTQ